MALSGTISEQLYKNEIEISMRAMLTAKNATTTLFQKTQKSGRFPAAAYCSPASTTPSPVTAPPSCPHEAATSQERELRGGVFALPHQACPVAFDFQGQFEIAVQNRGPEKI